MTMAGGLSSVQAGKATGFVGYPQRYELNPDPTKSIIHGVDQEGKQFKLTLAIPERFIEQAKRRADVSIPEVGTMAETHRRARNPCLAHPDNGPDTKTGGVFLAEQVQVVDAQNGICKANWLSILRDMEDSPSPATGIGYLEINAKQVFTPEAEAIKLRLIEMNNAFNAIKGNVDEVDAILGIPVLDFSMEREQLALSLYRMMDKTWFIGCDVQYHRIQTLAMDDMKADAGLVTDLISANTENGMYGGVIIRPVLIDQGKRVVDVSSVRRLNHQYDYVKRQVPNTDTVWDNFLKHGGTGWYRAMKSKGYEIEVIPVQRINCGGKSNEKYGAAMTSGFSKQLKAFVDTRFHHAPYVNFAMQNANLASPIAMRLADTRRAEFGGNVLLSTIHSFGPAIGNVLELDANAERTLSLSSTPVPTVTQKRKPARTTDYSF